MKIFKVALQHASCAISGSYRHIVNPKKTSSQVLAKSMYAQCSLKSRIIHLVQTSGKNRCKPLIKIKVEESLKRIKKCSSCFSLKASNFLFFLNIKHPMPMYKRIAIESWLEKKE